MSVEKSNMYQKQIMGLLSIGASESNLMTYRSSSLLHMPALGGILDFKISNFHLSRFLSGTYLKLFTKIVVTEQQRCEKP